MRKSSDYHALWLDDNRVTTDVFSCQDHNEITKLKLFHFRSSYWFERIPIVSMRYNQKMFLASLCKRERKTLIALLSDQYFFIIYHFSVTLSSRSITLTFTRNFWTGQLPGETQRIFRNLLFLLFKRLYISNIVFRYCYQWISIQKEGYSRRTNFI